MRNLNCLILPISLFLMGCNLNSPDKSSGLIKVDLQPMVRDASNGLRWSPKGEKLPLTDLGKGLGATLFLGEDQLPPIGLWLHKSEGAENYDLLDVDLNRNGLFQEEEDTLLTCEPNITRGKVWSSFTGEVQIPFSRKGLQKKVVNPYPISFWYVEDPASEENEMVLRYSRSGWMEGTVETPLGKMSILITESKMDGIFDRNDSWALAPDSSRNDIFTSKLAKSMGSHAWFGEQAFGIDTLLSSGRTIWIKQVDPQISRAEEETQNDWLAPDRAAQRSGNKVNFLHDYSYALELAQKRNQKVLLDFETSWCGPCKTMDQYVYTADTIVSAASSMVSVKIDGDEQKELVKKYQVSGYPTVIVLDSSGSELTRASGYQSVAKMLELLR